MSLGAGGHIQSQNLCVLISPVYGVVSKHRNNLGYLSKWEFIVKILENEIIDGTPED